MSLTRSCSSTAFRGRRAAARGPSCGWLDDAPEGESFVGCYGRVFDITVLSRPDANTIGLHNRAIESGLFESGRPILLSPPVPSKDIATNVMIHWNCSTEQARATAFAMPLLQQAQRVTVLTVSGGQAVPGPTAEQLLKYLQNNGIPAKPMTIGLEGRNTGEAVLRAGEGRRLRPPGQGRVHPEPAAPDDFRRRHEPHPGQGRVAGSDGALLCRAGACSCRAGLGAVRPAGIFCELIFARICATQASIGWQVGSCLTMASVLARIASAGSVRSSGSPNGWLTCQGEEQ